MMSKHVHRVALGLYSLLALLLTWPLITRLTTHVPGIAQWAFDESTFLWNIWYFKEAAVDRLASPLHTELIWYPLGIDLILYTYNFFHALVAQPLMLAVNLPFGSNLALLSSTVLSGYGTFLLVRYLLARAARAETNEPQYVIGAPGAFAPALIAGLVYAFASNRAVYAALGHYDMVTTQWIPFYALMLLRSLDSDLSLPRRRKAAALAGLFFALTGLAEMISALFLAIFTLIAGFVYLAQGATAQQATRPGTEVLQKRTGRLWVLVSALAMVGVMAFLLWSPVLIPILRQFLTDDFSLQGWGEAIPLSTDLLGWFTPTVLHPLWGSDLVAELRRVQLRALAENGSGFRDVNTVFLGWVCLVLAVVGAVRYGRRVAIWVWTSVVFGLFTLGPFLQIDGRYRFDLDGIEATFPLPYALLHYIPIIKANRAPNRNSVLLMLGIAVLVGYALYWLWQQLGGGERRTQSVERKTENHLQSPVSSLWPLVSIVLAGAVLFEHLAIPLPLSDARIPAVYDVIAADPRPVSVLQVPLGWRNSFGVFGAEQTLLQYYQTAHGKPILGGNISRAPDFKLAYFQRIPYFQALTEIEFGWPVAPDVLERARDQADELAYLYNVGYVLLFPPIPQRFPYADHWQESWAFVKETLPLEAEPFWAEDGVEAYRVIQPPGADHFELDLGVGGAFPYRGEGWDASETDQPYEASATWATAHESRLFVPLRQVDPAASYVVRVRVHPFAYPESPQQRVALAVNSVELGEHQLADGWQEIIWTVPGRLLTDGLNRLQFEWGYAAPPRQVIPGGRPIGSTGVELPIDADLKGFADGAFIALFDEEGNQTDASAGRLGVNVTVLDRESGAIRQAAGFDTTANSFESGALAEFLRQVELGAPVLVASYGNAGAHLTEDAVAALQAIGAGVTLAELQSNYFAIAGVQGAAPGTAAVVLDPADAFLRISLNRDRRLLAAAVDWVRIQRAE
ncbi:MAG: hypothetical protein DCC55_26025 [Chloroflexi bacterium]|nr:MAG: hypothetical protein DCC55_26025 [Chloroflexota bacterium]